MIYLPTGEQMRRADLYTIEEIGVPSMVLMERAALEVVRCMEEEQLDFRKVLVICGSGNNGGDGYAIARLLHLKGHDVTIFFAGNSQKRSEENAQQAKIAAHYEIPVITNLGTEEYSVIIDALFGTGLKREVTGHYREVLCSVNQMAGKKVAVDLPSGIHDTTGARMGIAFCADLTVAIAFPKRGLFLQEGNVCAGKILTGDIGISSETFSEGTVTFGYEKQDLFLGFPKRKKNSHKGSYGKVLMIAGSKGMSGAAYLSAKAAYAVGAGLVQIYTHEENRVILQQLLPEAIITTYDTFDSEQLEKLIQWADLIGIGCGLGKSDTAERVMQYTLERALVPCVVDADGINILSKHMEWIEETNALIVLTPHMKEMSRMLQCSVKELIEQRMEKLHAFVERYKVVCVLKDARTLVAKEHQNTYLNLSGNAAMAKAGSGDVLAGVIVGILAQQCVPYTSACLGVFLHGLAGDMARDKKGAYSVLASDLVAEISSVLKNI
ncbi:NAD(P)H-hydrate dehydratase [Coprococcus sp. AM97-06]|uniref:NAD(P)H-hydrate dehydratase n=1 Tax=Coprococcus sp. AM97-06 TaxID=2997993 RepID=UPI0022E606CA|nr:NAD(P)H-hydrate dehydratase [Coprococcus sp. AM97-06]